MMNKSILITGGAGFIGSNFVLQFMEAHEDAKVVVLDMLTYAADISYLEPVRDDARFTFVHGNICDGELAASIMRQHDIRGVIHFAAESHVDNSIANPRAFVDTNVLGTFTLLNAAREYWMSGPFAVRAGYEDARFHHISTDEVYGTLGDAGFFTEATPYAPNSPYSASKAGSDMLVRSYHHTYGMNVVTTNCSNNYGPRQHAEKLIPTIIRKALAGEAIPIYGDGENVRDWLYVLDHCRAIDLVFRTGRAGEVYNIGGRNERTNLQIVGSICKILDERRPRADGASYSSQITFVADRPGHDRRYAIDATKLERDLGWRAAETFDTGIVKTVEWYLN